MVSYRLDLRIGGTIEALAEPAPVGKVMVTARFSDGFTVTGEGDMAYTMAVMMEVGLEVAYVDQAGNPARVDGDVIWTSSNDALVSVISTGATSATIQTAGGLGSAQITAEADADLGTGIKSLVTLMDVTVVAGEAVAGTISPVGEAVPVSG